LDVGDHLFVLCDKQLFCLSCVCLVSGVATSVATLWTLKTPLDALCEVAPTRRFEGGAILLPEYFMPRKSIIEVMIVVMTLIHYCFLHLVGPIGLSSSHPNCVYSWYACGPSCTISQWRAVSRIVSEFRLFLSLSSSHVANEVAIARLRWLAAAAQLPDHRLC